MSTQRALRQPNSEEGSAEQVVSFCYNPGIAMMPYAITAALRDSECKDIRTLLRDRVMRPIGVPDGE